MRSITLVSAASSIALASAQTYNPTPRWGQKAMFVPAAQAVYYVGGEVSSTGAQITNEVLVLPLNTTNPAFLTAPSTGLSPTAFGTLSFHHPLLYHVGGLTQDCSSDALVHTLDVTSGSSTWQSFSPQGMVRRRGAAALWTYGAANPQGEVMITGGMIDEYVCSGSTYAYLATDILPLPLSSNPPDSISMPTNLTGPSSRPVVDFSLTLLPDGSAMLGGGADIYGNILDLEYMGHWSLGQGIGYYGGWSMVRTTGDIPSGRVGHNMVAHPTLDMLIMHGGSTAESSTSGATSLLSFLNLTTLVWSTPSNLQPPASAARAWHSSVMTPSGVLISAFGLDGSGQPRNDVVYLDMRDPDMSKWSWKSQWSEAMINGVTTESTSDSSAGVATSPTALSKPKLLESTIIPILLFLLGAPIIVFFARRHVRRVRDRRMAQHFELDGGENLGRRSFHFTNPFDQFLKTKPRRSSSFASSGLPKPNSDEPDSLKERILALIPRRKSKPGSAKHGREMAQIASRVSDAAGGSEKVQWEEIDFGLGKVDEARRGSASDMGSSISRGGTPTPILRKLSVAPGLEDGLTASQIAGPPQVQFHAMISPRLNQGPTQTRERLPSFSVHPPSLPGTPLVDEGTPLSVLEYPVLRPVDIQSPTGSSPQSGFITAPSTPNPEPAGPLPPAAVEEWANLADQLQNHSIFKGPPSRAATRSPSPVRRTPSPRVSHNAPAPLDYQRRAPSTVRLVSQPGQGQPRRISEGQLAYPAANPTGVQPRQTSQPTSVGRDLTARATSPAREYAEMTRSLGYTEPSFARPRPPLPQTPSGNRLSNPPPFPLPSSPLPSAPRPSATEEAQRQPSGQRGRRQGSGDSTESKLRITNATPADQEGRNMY